MVQEKVEHLLKSFRLLMKNQEKRKAIMVHDTKAGISVRCTRTSRAYFYPFSAR